MFEDPRLQALCSRTPICEIHLMLLLPLCRWQEVKARYKLTTALFLCSSGNTAPSSRVQLSRRAALEAAP